MNAPTRALAFAEQQEVHGPVGLHPAPIAVHRAVCRVREHQQMPATTTSSTTTAVHSHPRGGTADRAARHGRQGVAEQSPDDRRRPGQSGVGTMRQRLVGSAIPIGARRTRGLVAGQCRTPAGNCRLRLRARGRASVTTRLVSTSASRSAILPLPGTAACESISCHGTSTNARSCARGCGRVELVGVARPGRRPRSGRRRASAARSAGHARGRRLPRPPALGRAASRPTTWCRRGGRR